MPQATPKSSSEEQQLSCEDGTSFSDWLFPGTPDGSQEAGAFCGSSDGGSVVGPEVMRRDGGAALDLHPVRSINLHSWAPARETPPLQPPPAAEAREAGRLQELEARLAEQERACAASNAALQQALQRAAEVEAEAAGVAELSKQLKQLQAEHSLLLELLGERIERVAELEEQCEDMRRVFKEQLGEACTQLQRAREALAAAGRGGRA